MVLLAPLSVYCGPVERMCDNDLAVNGAQPTYPDSVQIKQSLPFRPRGNRKRNKTVRELILL